MNRTTTITMLVAASFGTWAHGAISQWETFSQGVSSNVTTSTNGGSGYVLNGSAGEAYDYGALDAIGGSAVDGSTVEFIYNFSDVGGSIILGSFLSWSPGNEWQYLKAEQWNNTGKFGLTTPGAWDKTFTADSLFDQDVHQGICLVGSMC